MMQPIFRAEFDVAELRRRFPARWFCANKKLVHQIVRAASDDSSAAAPPPLLPLEFSRWPALGIPDEAPAGSSVEITVVDGPFQYSGGGGGGEEEEFHLNFADARLFGAYSGSLLAQDEQMVLEHPDLGALREALTRQQQLAQHAWTVGGGGGGGGQPTPVVVRNVRRVCALDSFGHGIYGNRFASASEAQVRAALTVLPAGGTTSHIVAAEAPCKYGHGAYNNSQLVATLTTAFTAFKAAVLCSSSSRAVTMHTGAWGCGAYGGNTTVMAACQMRAAQAAGLARIVFHATTPAQRAAAEDAARLVAQQQQRNLVGFLDAVLDRNLQWGISDGN